MQKLVRSLHSALLHLDILHRTFNDSDTCQLHLMPLTLADTLPTDTNEQEYLWTLNFGPQHPATHTTLRLVLTLDGEKVVDAVPHIGYLHSGFEKLGEHLDFNQYVTIVDRMNYISPVANEIAWHHAVEKLLGIELTPRCKYLRTILAELMRLHDHLLNVGTAALDLGAFTAFLYGVPAAGEDLRHRRVRLGAAVSFELHARRRRAVRREQRLGREGAGVRSASFCPTLRRNRRAADAESHLHRSHQGHRRADARRTRSTSAPPARSRGPAAWCATCARTSRTWRTRTSTSK